MKWKFVVVGKPSLQYARMGIEEYLKRLQKENQNIRALRGTERKIIPELNNNNKC